MIRKRTWQLRLLASLATGCAVHAPIDSEMLGTHRGGVTESFGVATNGDRSSRTDGDLHSTQCAYDAYGHWTEERNALGRQLSATDGNGKITTRQFDDRDRLIQQTEPEGRLTVLTHDGADRKRSETLSG
ncbi:MAG: hypothetical protein ACT4NL_18860, partial [Pseudomarimonas sp.]